MTRLLVLANIGAGVIAAEYPTPAPQRAAPLALVAAAVQVLAVVMSLPVLVAAGDGRGPSNPAAPAAPAERNPVDRGRGDAVHETRRIEGWTVHVNCSLLEGRRAETVRAIDLLRGQLAEVARVVPAPAVEALRRVPLWVSPEYPGVPPRAEYHPSADWLRDNGRDPAMAKGVEITNVAGLGREVARMPMLVLHELAHAYHDRVLGFDHPGVIACYERARAGGGYDAVERRRGPARPPTRERAYAMADAKEYFAECSEAFFGRNDFFPFTREDLARHDPEMFNLLGRLWSLPAPQEKQEHQEQPEKQEKQEKAG